MNPSFWRLRLCLSLPRLLPHLLLLGWTKQRAVVLADLTRWAAILNLGPVVRGRDAVRVFLNLMTFTPEFRTLFYLRTGNVSWLVRWLCPGLRNLRIGAGRIGPGLYIQHGEETYISARSIGANCWIGRHVIVGYANDTDMPTIGDNVRIYSGARIIGKVTVGNGATIGLNTVILSNVRPHTTMFGVPGRVVWRDPQAPEPTGHPEGDGAIDAVVTTGG
jgi:serine O-acetyltransferase